MNESKSTQNHAVGYFGVAWNLYPTKNIFISQKTVHKSVDKGGLVANAKLNDLGRRNKQPYQSDIAAPLKQ